MGKTAIKKIAQDSEMRKILEELCRKADRGSSTSHNELRYNTGLSDRVLDRKLKNLIELGVVKERKFPEIHKQKVFYEPDPELCRQRVMPWECPCFE